MKTKYAVSVLVVVFCLLKLSLAAVVAAEGINWYMYDRYVDYT
jgi:hypothetical protein